MSNWHCTQSEFHEPHTWKEPWKITEDYHMCDGGKAAVKHFVRAGVAALVVRGGSILLLKRKGAHGSGTWAPPGGWMDFGERPEETAERETMEELGIQVTALKPVGYTNDIFRVEGVHDICVWVLCEPATFDAMPRIMEPDKCEDWMWVQPEMFGNIGPLFQPLDHFWTMGGISPVIGGLRGKVAED